MLFYRRESNSCSFVFIRGSFLARFLVEVSEAFSVCVGNLPLSKPITTFSATIGDGLLHLITPCRDRESR